MATVYVFGNELLPEDNLPLRLKPALTERFPNISFVVHDPTDNIHPAQGVLTLIDTAEGIDEVVHIDSLEHIDTEHQPCSLHDFDLAFNLKLLEKLGELTEVHIIAVPMHTREDTALDGVSRILKELFPVDAQEV